MEATALRLQLNKMRGQKREVLVDDSAMMDALVTSGTIAGGVSRVSCTAGEHSAARTESDLGFGEPSFGDLNSPGREQRSGKSRRYLEYR